MVLFTLHTNDAPQTLTRLMNMGVALFNIASSVTADHRSSVCASPVQLQGAAGRRPKLLLNAGFTEADIDGTWTPTDRAAAIAAKARATRAGRHLSR